MEQTEQTDVDLWDEECRSFFKESKASRPRLRWGRVLMLTAVLLGASILVAIVLGLVFLIASVLTYIGFFHAVLGI